jgi:phosphopantothenoylcysteine decarboxylase / phosphopantothenate---cysteine ligase
MSNFLIGVTGGIAAYKVADITSALIKNGHEVKIIMTESAKKFITPLTLATMSRHPVYDESSEWAIDGGSPDIKHIELAKWAKVFVIVPATANTITKIALGIADNLLTSTYLALNVSDTYRAVVICPAMNTNMWAKNWIQDHLKTLSSRYHHIIVPPEEGLLACGDVGMGKLPSTRTIIEKLQGALPFLKEDQ